MKFTNFAWVDTVIEVDGWRVDLHNVALLRSQRYEVGARRLELVFSGAVYNYPADPAGLGERTFDVTLTFAEVAYFRALYRPRLEDLNACLEGFRRVTDLVPPGVETEVDNFFASHERDDWSNTYYLPFIWGADFLIEAGSVSATLRTSHDPSRR